MTDLYKWINLISKNFDFQPNETVRIDMEYGGGVGKFLRLGMGGNTAIIDIKGNIAEYPLDNVDRVVTGEQNIYDEPETHQYSDFQADAVGNADGVDQAHELNDKPELTPGDMVEVDGAFGVGNGKGYGVFVGYSLDGFTALVNIDSQVKSFPSEYVSVSSAVADAEEFLSTGNDGALSPLSYGDQNKLTMADEHDINIIITDLDGDTGQKSDERSKPCGENDMQKEQMSMDELLSIVEKGQGDTVLEAGKKCCDACKGDSCDGKCCDDSKCSGEVDECNESRECTCESYDCETCFPIDLSGISEDFDFVRDVVNKDKDDDDDSDDKDKDDDDDDDDSDDNDKDDELDEGVDSECKELTEETLTEGVIGGMMSIPDMTTRTSPGSEEAWLRRYMDVTEGDHGFDDVVDDGDGIQHSSDAELGIGDMTTPEYRDVEDDDDDEIFRLMVELDQSEESQWDIDQLMSFHDKGKDAMIRKWHLKVFGESHDEMDEIGDDSDEWRV